MPSTNNCPLTGPCQTGKAQILALMKYIFFGGEGAGGRIERRQHLEVVFKNLKYQPNRRAAQQYFDIAKLYLIQQLAKNLELKTI